MWLFNVIIFMASYMVDHGGLALGKMTFKMGFLGPWTGTFEDSDALTSASALTSSSAVSLAIEAIHDNPTLGDHIQLR